VLLSEQGDTQFDLKFRLFGVPVRVHPFFWLVTAMLGWNLVDLGFQYLLLWIACCFFSILLHEMGHVLMGRVFGTRGHIVLQGLCGLAVGASGLYDRWKRVLVSLAGPGIQILFTILMLAGLATFGNTEPIPEEYLAKRNLVDQWLDQIQWLTYQPTWPAVARHAIWFLFQINLYWALINLLPVYPLDGGQVSREFCTWIWRNDGVRYSLVASIVTAIVVAVNSLLAWKGPWSIPYVPKSGPWFALFFGVLAFESFQLLQFENAKRSRWQEPDDRMPWEKDPDEWKRR